MFSLHYFPLPITMDCESFWELTLAEGQRRTWNKSCTGPQQQLILSPAPEQQRGLTILPRDRETKDKFLKAFIKEKPPQQARIAFKLPVKHRTCLWVAGVGAILPNFWGPLKLGHTHRKDPFGCKWQVPSVPGLSLMMSTDNSQFCPLCALPASM